MCKKIGVMIGGLVLIIISYIWLIKKAESYFFYPDDIDYGLSPTQQNLQFEVVNISSINGIQLNGWFVPAVINEAGGQDATQAKGTVIHVHGNAANITNHWSFISWLPSQGYNVLTFDYRSYGQSDAIEPTIKGLYEDTNAVIHYVLNRSDLENMPVFMLGQSLGGNNTLAALAKMSPKSRERICAAVIDSTFYSYSLIANDKVSGAGILLANEYSANVSLSVLSDLPILFLHGKKDRIIPYQHSEQLYALQTDNRALLLVEGADHLAALYRPIFGERYINEVARYLDLERQKCVQK
ncbi:alpha/beta hydrolase [Wohlfahrtiimonas larvae]|uniref:Alpha/beta hydrolase n=1 Tax=Wohlfahrtiimonas larvae TaxID=1157986 RepID=A0ABP9MHB5_9GAMM|nr:alpha/beta hydrolase [Wohlfahrtiimonas larvae]